MTAREPHIMKRKLWNNVFVASASVANSSCDAVALVGMAFADRNSRVVDVAVLISHPIR
jgi:hypothetical protein